MRNSVCMFSVRSGQGRPRSIGTYHHVSQQHLKRYLAEFDFRYNESVALGVDDPARMEAALMGILRKRLMYRGSSGQPARK